MPTVKPIFTNAIGGYQQPVTVTVDTLTARGFYAQGSSVLDTSCGVTRPSTAQLALIAAGGPSATLNASGVTPTLNVPLADGSGNSIVISSGTLDTTTGLLFPNSTTQTTTAAQSRVRTTNVSNSTTTSATTGLSFPVAVGTVYAFDFYGVFGRTSGSTAALRFSFSTPVLGFSNYIAYRNNALPAAGTALIYQQNTLATAFSMAPSASGTAATTYGVALNGIFVPVASGTFELRFSPSIAGETMTVYPGSYLSLRVANT